MSTLEHNDGESDASQPRPERVEPEPEPASDAEPAPEPAPADPTDHEGPEPADVESAASPGDPDASPDPAEGSTLERSSPIDPFEADEIAVAPASVRHAPRYGRFATIGGLLGLALGFMLTPFARYDEPGMVLDPWGFGLLLAAILTPIGILIGCILALVADRRSRRARRS